MPGPTSNGSGPSERPDNDIQQNGAADSANIISQMMARGHQATQNSWSTPQKKTQMNRGMTNSRSAPRLSKATYHRIMIDGDEGDTDFDKCAELIASTIQSRLAYKALDKGENEERLSPEKIQELFLVETDSSKELSKTPSMSNKDLLEKPFGDSSQTDSEVTSGNPAALSAEEGKVEKASNQLLITFEGGVHRFNGMKTELVPWEKYVRDVKAVYRAIENGPCLSTARTRLTTLSEKFQLFCLLNSTLEAAFDSQIKSGGVYANCAKVDNVIDMKSSVTAPKLLNFITTTARDRPDTPLFRDPSVPPDAPEGQKFISLKDFLKSGGVTNPQELTVEGLCLHPTLYRNKFVSYDMLDEKLNPAGKFGADLLQSVLSITGPNEGDLLGSLIRPELECREFAEKQVTATELQLELYGHNPLEIFLLASWLNRQGFNSFSRNMWTLTIPRSKPRTGPNTLPVACQTIGDQLRHIFYPMMMATVYPRDPEWEDVALMLRKTGAICIRTESVIRTQNFFSGSVDPDAIRYTTGCSDYYFFYYVWANLAALNALRARYGLNTINFCPSVYEPASTYDQLVSSFLLADTVYHASSLQKSWIMQYLFMICRIGVVVSPLRDNALSISYFDHSIVRYFQQGLLVSIATSRPLHFHHHITQPLTEEYATLMKLRSLTGMDICELSRNSVINSNFSLEMKKQWLGANFSPVDFSGNDMKKSCVCDYRLQFRQECAAHEETVLNLVLSRTVKDQKEIKLINMIPFSKSVQIADLVQQFRSSRKMDYTDRRTVYPRININGGSFQSPATVAVETLKEVISLRKKYTNFRVVDVQVEDVFNDTTFDEGIWEYNNYYGVFLLSRIGKSPTWPTFIPTVSNFIEDVSIVRKAVVGQSALRQLAAHRLNLLERKFLLHLSLNISREAGAKEDKDWNNRDFFTAHKVDNNVQTDAGMNARTLLEFFVEKALNNGHDVVFEENNMPVTLRQLLSRHGIQVDLITVDELNHLVNTNQDIRTIFLSTDNYMQGRYFAELTKRTLELYQEDAYNYAENRLIVYGKSEQEWYNLAHWFDRYGMASPQNRWMINLPRQYRRQKQQGYVKNFGEYLDNVFKPLWEISLHPAKDTKFHYFLTHVSGFDSIDDESRIDLPLSNTFPHDWDTDANPPHNLYLYYIWANIASLNEFRATRGLGTFTFRPQCGEAGGVDHLIGGFLLANSINHGVTLAKHPVLEYMYYITQLGVAMSPLSNTAGASAYLENPFPLFFHRGLNVSLATNAPLYFHFTREPLIEEYSIAAKLWKFEFNDLSEIARNSVLQSGFPPAWKEKALGKLFYLRSTLGNDVRKSRVSDIRVAYRFEVYHAELNFLDEQLSGGRRMPRALSSLEEEVSAYELKRFETNSLPYVAELEGSTGKDDLQQGSLEARRTHIQADIERLDHGLNVMQVLAEQITGQNNMMASRINEIRKRLKNSGLSILGSLQGKKTEPSSEESENSHKSDDLDTNSDIKNQEDLDNQTESPKPED